MEENQQTGATVVTPPVNTAGSNQQVGNAEEGNKPEEAKIPFNRFKEELDKRKSIEAKYSELESKFLEREKESKPQLDYENLRKDDVEKVIAYEREQAKKEYEREMTLKQKALEKEAEQVKESIDLYKAEGLQFDEDTLIKLYEEFGSMDKAMSIYKKYELPNYIKSLEEKKQTHSKRLKNSEPNSAKSTKGDGSPFVPGKHSWESIMQMGKQHMK